MLEAIVADPQQKLTELEILSEAERHQLLIEWNQTDADYPRDQRFIQIFEDQVDKYPDSIAATYKDHSLTYQQLNIRSNQLAHTLINRGVGQEVIVSLLAERDIDLLTAILAVWKAGGAYLPIDPLSPPSRIAEIIRQSGSRLLLAIKQMSGLADEAALKLDEKQRPVIEKLDEMLARAEPEGNPAVSVEASNLAYVIYTSGSTGK